MPQNKENHVVESEKHTETFRASLAPKNKHYTRRSFKLAYSFSLNAKIKHSPTALT